MKKALEGLSGVAKVEVDYRRDLFRVVVKQGVSLSFERIRKEIEKLGYKVKRVKKGVFETKKKKKKKRKAMPSWLKEKLRLARQKKKPLLLVFSAKWCSACQELYKKLESPKVLALLKKHFLFFTIEVEKHPELSQWFGVEIVPKSFVISPKGKILGHIQGVPSAKEYVARLQKIITPKLVKLVFYVEGMT